jgi:16S rRNA (guanine(966)-N(2))-methyltransferase RsmD
MKIIAGTLKGRKVLVPTGKRVRPTGAKVKEALFSIIADEVCDACVLDVFSGSGSVGIEALSRGAASCTFVERDKSVIDVLAKNLSQFGLEDRGKILPLEAKRAMKLLEKQGERFDIIFLDPPYSYFVKTKRIVESLSPGGVLAPEGLLIWEHAVDTTPHEKIGSLQREREKKYGDTALSFYRAKMRYDHVQSCSSSRII